MSTSKDELRKQVIDILAPIVNSPVLVNNLLHLITTYGIEERENEVGRIIDRELGLDYGDKTDYYLKQRIAELTKLKGEK